MQSTTKHPQREEGMSKEQPWRRQQGVQLTKDTNFRPLTQSVSRSSTMLFPFLRIKSLPRIDALNNADDKGFRDFLVSAQCCVCVV